MIDYIMCDQNLYEQSKNFKTWEEEFSLVGDHRILTVEIESRLTKKADETGGGRRGEERMEKEN